MEQELKDRLTTSGQDGFKQDHVSNLTENLEEYYDTPKETFTPERIQKISPLVNTEPSNSFEVREYQAYDGPAPETIGDSIGTSFEAFRLTDLSVSESMNELGLFFSQFDGMNEIRKEEGKAPIQIGFGDNFRWLSPFAYSTLRKRYEDMYERGEEIDPVYKEYFDTIKEYGLANSEGIKKGAIYETKLKNKELQEQIEANPWYGGVIGTIGAAITDPVVAATLPLGGEAILGRASFFGKSGILMTAAGAARNEFVIGAATEIAIQPSIYDYKDDLDLDYSVGDAIINIASAGVGGAVIRGAGSIGIDYLKLSNFKGQIDFDISNDEAFKLYEAAGKDDFMFDMEYLTMMDDYIKKLGLPEEETKALSDQLMKSFNEKDMGDLLNSFNDVSKISRMISSGNLTDDELAKLTKQIDDIIERFPEFEPLYKDLRTIAELDAKGFIKRRDGVVGVNKEGEILLESNPDLYKKFLQYTTERPLHKGVKEAANMGAEGRVNRTQDEVVSLNEQQDLDISVAKKIGTFFNLPVLKNISDFVIPDKYKNFKVDITKPLTKAERKILDKLKEQDLDQQQLKDIINKREKEISEIPEKGDAHLKDKEWYKKYKALSKKIKTRKTKEKTAKESDPTLHQVKQKQLYDIANKAKRELDQPEVNQKDVDVIKQTKLDTIDEANLPPKEEQTAKRAVEAVANRIKAEIEQKWTQDLLDDLLISDMEDIAKGKLEVDSLTGDLVGENFRIKADEINDFLDSIQEAMKLAC